MTKLIRTNASNADFKELVKLLDISLQLRDGEEHYFFAQFNTTENIKEVVVAYDGVIAVGCGAIKHYSEDTIEIKRMFVRDERRLQGIASKVLTELEEWAKELGYLRCILETGKNQPEAISLYKKNGYNPIPNFGPYKNVDSSACFEKVFVAG